MTTTDQVDADEWANAHITPEFQRLRRNLRMFVFPMTALCLTWYLLYVLLADYAHEFMAIKLTGNVTIGLVLGLLQFVSTFGVTGLYVRFASRKLDPLADLVRANIESSDS